MIKIPSTNSRRSLPGKEVLRDYKTHTNIPKDACAGKRGDYEFLSLNELYFLFKKVLKHFIGFINPKNVLFSFFVSTI
jgi:hypothetical protein